MSKRSKDRAIAQLERVMNRDPRYAAIMAELDRFYAEEPYRPVASGADLAAERAAIEAACQRHGLPVEAYFALSRQEQADEEFDVSPSTRREECITDEEAQS